MSDLDYVRSRYDGVTNVNDGGSTWDLKALCPDHDDKRPSLHISYDGTKHLVKCHAGCDKAITWATFRQRCPELTESTNGSAFLAAPIYYAYHDESGEIRHYRKRYATQNNRKNFVWVHPDMVTKGRPEDSPWLLYNLPAVIEGNRAGQTIMMPEGEKDADTLIRLGHIATTVGGVTNWRNVAPCAIKALTGAHVVIIIDNDDAGKQLARDEYTALHKVTASIKVMRPADGHKDISDHIGAGLTLDDLVPFDVTEAVDLLAGVDLYRVAEIKPVDVEWLWYGRLARGKIVVLSGEPGLAKSAIAIDFAARISRGDPFPGEDEPESPGVTVIMSGEDGKADTIRPRCEAAGANMKNIWVFDKITIDEVKRLPSIPRDIPIIRAIIDRYNVKLLILDVLNSFMESKYSANSDQDVRHVLGQFGDMAEETDCCILILRHLNKAPGMNAKQRGGGSVAIGGLARMELMVGDHPDDKDIEDPNERRKVLTNVKENLTKKPPSIDYRAIDVNGIVAIQWGNLGRVDADSLVGFESGVIKTDCDKFLTRLLANGDMWADAVFRECEREDFGRTMVNRSRKRLGIVATKEAGKSNGRWFWSLPDRTRLGPLPDP